MESPCEWCDGSGDVHRADGEWLGPCECVKRKNKFELTERQTAQVQRALGMLCVAYGISDKQYDEVKELKALFQPHAQHGFAELCGGLYCKCCQ